MRIITILSVLIAAMFMVSAARAQFQVPILDQVASAFASRPVSVYCRNPDEDTYMYVAWGYVKKPVSKAKYTVIHQDVCLGALAIDNDVELISDYHKALGVIVLTHEAYHLRRKPHNDNEAITDCRAFQHYDYAIHMLGGEQEIMDRLMPQAILMHFLHNREFPQYDLKSCKTPARYVKWLS